MCHLMKFAAGLIAVVATNLLPQLLMAQTAPQIDYLFPAGAQRGTKVTVEVGGKYMPGPCGLWIGGNGVRATSNTTEGSAEFTVEQSAVAGPIPIRIHSVQGGSSPRAFIVGDLPEVIETATAASQVVSPRVTINGRLHPKGDIDTYDLQLETGQQIVCAVSMRRLGSPGDAVLRLLDSDGAVVATGDNHRGADPLLLWRCPAAGRFALQIFDLNLAGAADSVYRLTVTDGPYLDYAYPAGLQSGVDTDVTLYGWNLPGDSLKQTIKPSGTRFTTQLSNSANQLELPVSGLPEANELEPNHPTSPQTLPAHVVVNGRFDQPGDEDAFRFAAKKGDRFDIRVESEQLGFPADAVLQVLKADGQLIRETDDVRPSRDPSYLFTVPADGEYVVALKERAGRGGPRFIYRLHLYPPQPSLELTVKAAEFAIVPGETLTIPVRVNPANGFATPLTLHVLNLPTGVTAAVVEHTPKKAGDVKLELKAESAANFTSGTFAIEARSAAEDSLGNVLATARLATSPTLPADTIPLWLAVSPKIPFQLATASSIQEAPRLAAFAFPVTVTRDEGFVSKIRLVGVDPDGRGTVVPLNGEILANSDLGAIPLIIQSAAIEGTTHRCRVMGVADVTGPDGVTHPVFHVAKGSMAMGCQPNLLTLKATPDRVRLSGNSTATMTLTLGRRRANGRVTVSLMPHGFDGVTAQTVVIESGDTQATIVLKVTPNADLPPETQFELQAETAHNGLPIFARTVIRITR